MKTIKHLVALSFFIGCTKIALAQLNPPSNPQSKSFYVDNFPNLLGTPEEANLISYLSCNHFDHIIIYGVDEIINSGRSCQLAHFIRDFKITSSSFNPPNSNGRVTAVFSGNWYNNYLAIVNYNSTFSFTSNTPLCIFNFSAPTFHEIDGFQFENEFWNAGPNTQPYNDMMTDLAAMQNHRASPVLNPNNIYLDFEIYLARFNYSYGNPGVLPSPIPVSQQAQEIADNFDRILFADYMPDPNDILDHSQTTIQLLLDNTTKPSVKISILYSNLCNASGPWLRSNGWDYDLFHSNYFTTPLATYINPNPGSCPPNYFYGCNQHKLILLDPTWFSYSFIYYYPDCDPNLPKTADKTSNPAKLFKDAITPTIGGCMLSGNIVPPMHGSFVTLCDAQNQSSNHKIYRLTDPTESYTFEAWIKTPDMLTPSQFFPNQIFYNGIFSNYSFNTNFNPPLDPSNNPQIFINTVDPNSINGFTIFLTNNNHLAIASPNFKTTTGSYYNWAPAPGNAWLGIQTSEVFISDDNIEIPQNTCTRITVKVEYLSATEQQQITFYINGVYSSQKLVSIRKILGSIGTDHQCTVGGWAHAVVGYLNLNYGLAVQNPVLPNGELEHNTYFKGLIDDVRLWDHPLESNRITTIPYLNAYADKQDVMLWHGTSGLISNWRFDERFYNQTVQDNSDNHYDGYLGSTMFYDQFDPLGVVSCYAYATQVSSYHDGDKKFLSLSANNQLNLGTGEFFMEAWLNPDDLWLSEEVILSNRDASGSNGCIWGIDANGYMFFQFGNSGTNRINTDPNNSSNIGMQFFRYDGNGYNQPVSFADISTLIKLNDCRHAGIERVIDNITGQTYMRFYLDDMRSSDYLLSNPNFSYINSNITPSGAGNFIYGWDATSQSTNTPSLSFSGMIDDARIFNISDLSRYYYYQGIYTPQYTGYVENEGYFMRREKRIMDHVNGGSSIVDFDFEDYKKDYWPNVNGTLGNQIMQNRAWYAASQRPASAILGYNQNFENDFDPYMVPSCSDVPSSIPEILEPDKTNGHKPFSKKNILFPDLSAYPNPFVNHIFINANQPIKEVSVCNILGELIYKDLSGRTDIETGTWHEGAYFITITTLSGMKITLLMIKA
ncbi:MAG: T9SS type A sorting domain-containing protein [Bacteroidia bacterium]|nr:T9SS type A sorting domain-containing protein [Bacteroidia bacterium]